MPMSAFKELMRISFLSLFFLIHLWGIIFVVFHRDVQHGTLGRQRKDPTSFLGFLSRAAKNYIVPDASS